MMTKRCQNHKFPPEMPKSARRRFGQQRANALRRNSGMLATKCATNPSPFWRADIEVMDWLYAKGITVIPNNL